MILADPIEDIQVARMKAKQQNDPYADVCFLSTVTSDAEPQVRAIALRDIDDNGFSLVINSHSPKWEQIVASGQCALTLLWVTVQRQYRVSGCLEPMALERLQQYWDCKGYYSRLIEYYYETVWSQSHPLPSREVLLQGIEVLKQQYPNPREMPLATSLKGVYLWPNQIDIWHGSVADRLHDRRLFTRTNDGWSYDILVP